MVSVSTILAGLSAVAASSVSASLTSLPTFNIPSFDYATLTQGDAPQRVLQSLQQDGIIALKNIPNYANLRERYLREAAQCAAINADPARDTFVSRKLFKDGTNRMTISTNAGRELAGSAIETDQACPGYRQLYEEFSATMERAVNTLGSTLDSTSFTASDGHKAISSRQLIGEAVRLDHFHAYEAAVSTTKGESGRQLQASDLSLPLHEDHGLFIAMSAPKFYQVDSTDARRLEEQALAEDASGLVIQTSSGQRVRPVLNADEVVIMMGTGASRWLKTSHAIPAVMHGMQMPEVMTSASGRRSLRAWFGKMTLLPAYQRMLLNNGMAFEEHVNATTRYLLTEDSSDLKAVGCATGRHLTASEGKCTLRTCTLKAGASAPEEPCSVICNREGHSEDDAPTCAEKCSCTSSSSPAERCWMLCVANLPSDKCALSSQTCNGQEIKCTASPTPSTTTPSTTKPTSSPGPTTTPTPTTPGTTTKAPSPTTPGETTASPSSTPASGSTDTTTSGSLPSSSNDSTVSPATSAVPSTTPASTNAATSMVTISSVVASVVVATVALL